MTLETLNRDGSDRKFLQRLRSSVRWRRRAPSGTLGRLVARSFDLMSSRMISWGHESPRSPYVKVAAAQTSSAANTVCCAPCFHGLQHCISMRKHSFWILESYTKIKWHYSCSMWLPNYSSLSTACCGRHSGAFRSSCWPCLFRYWRCRWCRLCCREMGQLKLCLYWEPPYQEVRRRMI